MSVRRAVRTPAFVVTSMTLKRVPAATSAGGVDMRPIRMETLAAPAGAGAASSAVAPTSASAASRLGVRTA